MLQNRPIALSLIAAGLLFFGVQAIIETIGALSAGRINLNLAVLLLPAGIGLLRLSDGWRKFTLTCLVLALVGLGGFVLYECFRPGQMPVLWFGQQTQGLARYILFIVLTCIISTVLGWALHTLTRIEVKNLFAGAERQLPPQ